MSVWSESRSLLKNHLLTSVYNSTPSHTKEKNKLTCLWAAPHWPEPFSCPPVRPKKEPGNSDKVTQDALHREPYKPEAEGRGVTPYPTGRWQAGGSSSLSYHGGGKEVTIYRGNRCQTGSPVNRRTTEEQVSASPSG